MMEIMRRVVRGILGHKSPLYRRLYRYQNFLSVLRKDGYKTWRILNELGEGGQSDSSSHAITLRNLAYPIHIRSKKQDVTTVINNIIREEYGQMAPPKPKWMIDAGAYIGDTTAYFLSRFSELKVIALEPSPLNFQLAKRNLEPYGERAILLESGLASKDGTANFSGDDTSASISETGFAIDCISIPSLLERFAIPRVDILKMDIEGAEEDVFNAEPEAWLNRVDMLIVEIHGAHIKSLISQVLAANGFSMTQYRSLWYCRSGK